MICALFSPGVGTADILTMRYDTIAIFLTLISQYKRVLILTSVFDNVQSEVVANERSGGFWDLLACRDA